jgi:hypothetical protein
MKVSVLPLALGAAALAMAISSAYGATALPARAPTATIANGDAVMGLDRAIPIKGWTVDTRAGIETVNKARQKGPAGLKAAATDPVTVFRPVVPCRLVDTRSAPNPVPPIGGPTIPPNSRRTINTNGNCGIPTLGVKGISLTLITFNQTPNTGGFISLVAPGASITGTNDIFNFGAQWSGTSVNTPTDSTGAFDVYISQATADIIIDVNGYYADLDNVDVGVQELDIVGNSPGDTFEVANFGTGSAIAADNFGGGAAVKIYNGSFAVSGAGVGSSTTAFILQVNTTAFGSGGNLCGGQPSQAVIDHPLLNNDPNAIVLVTPRESTTTPPGGSAGPVSAFYLSAGGCTPAAGNRWTIRDKSGAALINGSQYNVFIIKTS